MSSLPVVALITSRAWSPTVQFTLKLGALPGCLASALLIPGINNGEGQKLSSAPSQIYHVFKINLRKFKEICGLWKFGHVFSYFFVKLTGYALENAL